MRCDEFQSWWQRRLDGEPVEELAAWGDHLRECADCRALHRASVRLMAALSAARPCPPAELMGRVVRRVLQDRRADIRRRLVAVSALAAGVLLGIAGYARFRNPVTGPPANDPAPAYATTRPAGPAPAEPPRGALLNQGLREAGTALVSLVGRTANEAVVDGKLVLPTIVPAPAISGAAGWSEPLEPSARSLRDAGYGVSKTLEPVTASARRAVSLLLPETVDGSAPETPDGSRN